MLTCSITRRANATHRNANARSSGNSNRAEEQWNVSKRIIPIPTESESDFNRFWHIDLQSPVDRAELEAEALVLQTYWAFEIARGRKDRVIWAHSDPIVTLHGWITDRLRRIARRSSRNGVAA